MHVDIQPFAQHISALADLYRRGLLVPFVGSGMSFGMCPSWEGLVKSLIDEAGRIGCKLAPTSGGINLTHQADRAMLALGHLPIESRVDAYRKALTLANPQYPQQATALCSIWWPLLITTNYDDVLLLPYLNSDPGRPKRTPPLVLGRSQSDCHRVARSLHRVGPDIYWAIQGFVGGQVSPGQGVIPAARVARLAREFVLSHQQYQRAINANPQFRRVFADVFHQRSFLFLGSGILEDYLVNLFAEATFNIGVPRQPHFALLHEENRSRYDETFLQTRLGITPIFYKVHSIIPHFLAALKAEIIAPARSFAASGIRFTLSPPSAAPTHVYVEREVLPMGSSLSAESCIGISVGGGTAKGVLVGKQAQAVLNTFDAKTNKWETSSIAHGDKYTHKASAAPLYAVRARRGSGDVRDLNDVRLSVFEAICRMDADGFRVIHLGAIASGPKAPWHVAHPFVQTLAGVRDAVVQMAARPSTERPREIHLHVVDPRLWEKIAAGQLPISDVLSSGLVHAPVEVHSGDGDEEQWGVSSFAQLTVEQVRERCGLAGASARGYSARLVPGPQSADEPTMSPDTVVPHGAQIVFEPT